MTSTIKNELNTKTKRFLRRENEYRRIINDKWIEMKRYEDNYFSSDHHLNKICDLNKNINNTIEDLDQNEINILQNHKREITRKHKIKFALIQSEIEEKRVKKRLLDAENAKNKKLTTTDYEWTMKMVEKVGLHNKNLIEKTNKLKNE